MKKITTEDLKNMLLAILNDPEEKENYKELLDTMNDDQVVQEALAMRII